MCFPYVSVPNSAAAAIFFSLAALAQAPHGQTTARRNKILADAERMSLVVRLDRDTYLPGERVLITVAARNSTSAPLEMPDPFAPKGGAIDLFAPTSTNREAYPDGFAPTAAHPRRNNLDILQLKVPSTVVLAAGQELAKTFDSIEKLPGEQTSILSGGGAPREPGSYRLVFTVTKTVTADFRVQPALLEAIALVKLDGRVELPGWPDPRAKGKAPPPTSYPRGTSIAALGGDGAHWIIAARTDRIRSIDNLRKGELGFSAAAFLPSHVRVAQSTLPITSISGVSAPDDTITITWTDSSGKTGSIRVDKDRRVLPAQK